LSFPCIETRYRAVEITMTDSLFFCFHDEAEPLFLGSSRYQPALLIAVQLDQDKTAPSRPKLAESSR
jgi:hypothetical protein